MSLTKKSTETAVAPSSPYQLDPAQTLRAANALLKKLQTDIASRSQSADGKQDLLGDVEEAQEHPIWLYVTTKKHIVDQKRLKPGKIALRHSLTTLTPGTDDLPGTKVCLLTSDPQRKYKDLVADPRFPDDLRPAVARVLGLNKLKARYKSFESKRQLFGEYDIFLADDRIITYLPKLLGKTFYHTGAKRPIPVDLQGKKDPNDASGEKRKPLAQGGTKAIRDEVRPEAVGREVRHALDSALVHLSPSTSTSVKVATTNHSAEQVTANIETVVAGLVKTYVPQGWRGVKSLHIKGPETAALPIWLAEELWTNEQEVLEEDPVDRQALRKKQKLDERAAAKKRRIEEAGEGEKQASKKRKSEGVEKEDDDRLAKQEKKARKDELKKLKEQARSAVLAA